MKGRSTNKQIRLAGTFLAQQTLRPRFYSAVFVYRSLAASLDRCKSGVRGSMRLEDVKKPRDRSRLPRVHKELVRLRFL